MSKKKKILYILLSVIIIIQFIRPERNLGKRETENTIFVSNEVGQILQTSCFDCHSNYTVYPWYTNIQPIGWWLNHHVNEGKEELNFSEFEAYSLKRKLHKLEEIKEMVDEGEMPLSSYTLIHGDATLSAEQKEILSKWVVETRKYLSDTLSNAK
ncbi:MAG: heme-binding domain-containing protein [Bacteroidetes bacterium]|nr:heme-binding domain-containing protein [Bacteroidota bacterium]